MEWQLIETAPKDGTPILAWPCDGIPYVVSYATNLATKIGYWREASGELWCSFEPTHWMPLPEPPALGEKE